MHETADVHLARCEALDVQMGPTAEKFLQDVQRIGATMCCHAVAVDILWAVWRADSMAGGNASEQQILDLLSSYEEDEEREEDEQFEKQFRAQARLPKQPSSQKNKRRKRAVQPKHRRYL